MTKFSDNSNKNELSEHVNPDIFSIKEELSVKRIYHNLKKILLTQLTCSQQIKESIFTDSISIQSLFFSFYSINLTKLSHQTLTLVILKIEKIKTNFLFIPLNYLNII